MNNKRNRNTTPVRNEAYWSGLVERFFAAQTSEAEEKELREFLLSPRGADARYDEVRAVMSFLAVGRDVYGGHAATPSRPVALPFGGNLRPSAGALRRRANAFYWAAAVVAIAFLGVCAFHVGADGTRSVCYAYIGGEKTTDVDVVKSQMVQSMRNVENSGDGQVLQQQMEEMFAPL